MSISMNFPTISRDSLYRLQGYVDRLNGREITPERVDAPITEEQGLLRAIGREIMRNRPVPADAKPMTVQKGVSSPHANPQMTPAQIEANNRRLEEQHQRGMMTLKFILKQLEVLNTNPSVDTEAALLDATN